MLLKGRCRHKRRVIVKLSLLPYHVRVVGLQWCEGIEAHGDVSIHEASAVESGGDQVRTLWQDGSNEAHGDVPIHEEGALDTDGGDQALQWVEIHDDDDVSIHEARAVESGGDQQFHSLGISMAVTFKLSNLLII